MKRILLLFLFVCGPVFAQSTNVTATVVDANGQPFAGGTYQFTFHPSPTNPFGPYFWNGSPFNMNMTISGVLDGSGAFTVPVPSNTSISPARSTWVLSVSPASTSPGTQSFPISITGTNQNVSPSITPPPIKVVTQLRTAAYQDSEIVGALPGFTYSNLTDNTIHYCQGSPCAWISIGASGGGTTVGWFNVKNFGAKGDAIQRWDFVTNGTNQVCSAASTFTNDDKGKLIWISGLGTDQVALAQGTITGIASTHCVNTSSTSLQTNSGQFGVYGTDDTVALKAAFSAANTTGYSVQGTGGDPKPGTVYLPQGGYIYSKLPFDYNLNVAGTHGANITGDGSNSVLFYPAPQYDFTTTSANKGMLMRSGNGAPGFLSGFTNYMYGFNFGQAGIYGMDFSGAMGMSDVVTASPEGVAGGMNSANGNMAIYDSGCEGGGPNIGQCISVSGGGYTFFNGFNSNTSGKPDLVIFNINGAANVGNYFRWVGGLHDEGGTFSIEVINSTDVTFSNCTLYQHMSVDATSRVDISQCKLAPFNAETNASLDIAAGGVVTASQSTIGGIAAASAINNAGDFYDLGGNVIIGAQAGAGTYHRNAAAPPMLANVIPVTVNANSTSIQNLQSLVIPAGSINITGSGFHLVSSGNWITQAGQTPTLTVNATLGGVNLFSSSGLVSGALAASGDNFYTYTVDCVTSATGASGTLLCSSILTIGLTATAPSVASVYHDFSAANLINLTANETLQMQATFSTQPTTPFNQVVGYLLKVNLI